MSRPPYSSTIFLAHQVPSAGVPLDVPEDETWVIKTWLCFTPGGVTIGNVSLVDNFTSATMLYTHQVTTVPGSQDFKTQLHVILGPFFNFTIYGDDNSDLYIGGYKLTQS